MEFKFLDKAALVQQKKKYANFTITEIGGPEEIKRWREMQAAKETVYRMRTGEREARVQGAHLDSPKISTSEWKDKVAFAESERARLSQAELNVILYPPWESAPKPKVGVLQRFTQFVARVWKYANF